MSEAFCRVMPAREDGVGARRPRARHFRGKVPDGGTCRRLAAVFLVATLLPACAMEGDFGRPQTYSLLGFPLDAAYWSSLPRPFAHRSDFALTVDESEMRETAYRLRVQPHNLRPMKLAYAPEAAYAGHLTRNGYKYGPARLAGIDQQLEADHQSLTLFADAARRVVTADLERMRALVENDPYLRVADKRNARNRMRGNFAFIEGTFADLEKRISVYDYAIDRTRVETPGVSVFAVEGSLNHLRDRAASLRYELTQAYRYAEGNPGYPEARYHRTPGRRRPVPVAPPEARTDLRPDHRTDRPLGIKPFK